MKSGHHNIVPTFFDNEQEVIAKSMDGLGLGLGLGITLSCYVTSPPFVWGRCDGVTFTCSSTVGKYEV